MKVSDKTLSPSEPVEFVQGDDVKVVDGRKFAIIPTRALCDPRVNHLCFRVLAGYCMYAMKSYGDHRLTMVGQTRVAREIGVSQPTVSKYVRLLMLFGYMKRGKRPRYKYGKAQTHLIFYGKPIKNGGPGKPDNIIDQIEAHHNPSDDAPPVPVGGLNNGYPIRTESVAA